MNPKDYLRSNSGPRLMGLSVVFGVLYLLVFAMTSCSTAAGVGRDVQKLGNEIEEAAQ
ncbi:putative small secreted protein [Haloferula luteola]|uniref:Putative small secreted protein n=1 Tax=Haloferula luteola TaxID=595692 RepID=A0A840UX40_9BACT|nr:entericidin A/B family lipoprotein [Haloferula luteola]MBB5350342.1 putative small secreted protein [Haloferula luteola]